MVAGYKHHEAHRNRAETVQDLVTHLPIPLL